MKVYIAGPMRGIEGWNFPAFHEAEERWSRVGYQVFSPARTAMALGYTPDGCRTSEVDGEHLRHVIQLDVVCICAADAIALLPGWEKSTGATVELALAQFLSLPIYDAVTMDSMSPYPVVRPWSLASVLCPRCNGSLTPCSECDGTGYHRYQDFPDGTPNYSGSAACGACSGEAWIPAVRVRG